MDREKYDKDFSEEIMAIRKQAILDALWGFTDNPEDPDNAINAVIAGVNTAIVLSFAHIEKLLFETTNTPIETVRS